MKYNFDYTILFRQRQIHNHINIFLDHLLNTLYTFVFLSFWLIVTLVSLFGLTADWDNKYSYKKTETPESKSRTVVKVTLLRL